MFERFTDRARRVVVLAEEVSRRFNDSGIRPEHLALALIEVDGIASTALRALGVVEDTVRDRILAATQRDTGAASPAKIPFTPRAKKVLELSLREAVQLGHRYIGTEHIVLGYLREGEGEAERLLGVDAARVRDAVVSLLGRGGSEPNRSRAVTEAEARARVAAGDQPVTTGHLLDALLSDDASQASRALHALGVSTQALRDELVRTPIDGTSDAPPRPRSVEIKLGEATTMIEDSEIADALAALSPDQLRATLQRALGGRRKRRGTGTAAGTGAGAAAGGGAG
jgi:ATP-dependent Clp protease ATP-binding subunit ClpC